MRIINTIRQSLILLIVFLFVSGCAQKADDLEKAQDDIRKSEAYYNSALEQYKKKINSNKAPDSLYLELGRVYYSHGDFESALAQLKNSKAQEAKKLIAISYFRLGNFVDALDVFNREAISDNEYIYYQGLTCEKLNLFEQAVNVYRKINDGPFASLAKKRIDLIEKQANLTNIKEVSQRIFNLIKESPGLNEYPQAGALVLLADESIEVTQQNTQVSQMHYAVKILNERGKEDYSETQIEYDSTFEKVELEYARTIKPDGVITEVGSRHIRDVSKYLNFPLYSNARVYIISFPEVVEGAVIEYKVKIYRNQLVNKKDFVLAYSLKAKDPIINAAFNLRIPKERKLNIKILNEKYNDSGANLNPLVTEKEGFKIYDWNFKSLPQIVPESNMPPAVEINPALLLSTFESWDELYKWWWSLAKDKIVANDEIKSKVAELIKNKTTPEEKIRAIYNYCAQKVRYVAVEYGQAGFEPHKAEVCFRNKYGDCKDKAILLTTMLKLADISASPVLIATKEDYNLNEDFPSMLFNHAIACVFLNDKIIFMDPTAETCAFGDLPPSDQERRVIIFKEDGYKIIETPLYSGGHNLNKQTLNIKVNVDESISAQKEILAEGVYDQSQRYWLLYTQPELIEATLKEKIQSVSIGSKLSGYQIKNLDDLNKPVVLTYSFSGPEYFTEAGPLRIMPQLANLDTSLVAKDSRKYAIDFDFLDTKETYLEVAFPANYVIKYMPEGVVEDSPWLSLNVSYSQKDNKLYFKQVVELKRTKISVDEYPDFKKFFQKLALQVKQRIVLERKK
ncbi:MAG: DUF3857 domain-containing protein [Candidatus Omnitrophica bacterium]|nr:DUF3857 domain-containing protein [Candidatus Omnitrophota bacterium]